MTGDLQGFGAWVRRSCVIDVGGWIRRRAIAAVVAGACCASAAGCASSAPEKTPDVVELGAPPATASPTATATARASAPPASCVVHGTTLPFDGCDALTLAVSGAGAGASEVAYISDDADVKITFGGAPFQAAVVATSGRLRARGRLDASALWLPILRPIDAAAGHVKVFGGAPVRVRRVHGDDVEIDVWMGFGNLDTITAKAACKDLAFAPVKLARTDTDLPAVVHQPKGTLTLFDAPGGEELMRIVPRESPRRDAMPPGARPGIPRAANLSVIERRSGFARVQFEGTFVAIDAWVPDAEIEPGTGQGFGGGYGCGKGSGSLKGKPARVVRDTRLSLGESAATARPVDVEALQGAEVVRGVEEGGLVRIEVPKDAIRPPSRLAYWIDPGALE